VVGVRQEWTVTNVHNMPKKPKLPRTSEAVWREEREMIKLQEPSNYRERVKRRRV
jgi:hypothetical protein